MITSTILGLLIPFVGTSLGAACVLFMKNELSVKTTKMLSGFAAGVMIAASVWSLLIPALEQSQSLGKMQFVPAIVPAVFSCYFDIFDGLIQAYVFVFLTGLFIKEATE